LSSKPEAEQRAYVEQVLAQMSERSRKVTTWRMEGHTWRQIADRLDVNHAAVQRAYRRELRRLEARGISISNAKSTLERRAPGHRGKPHQEANSSGLIQASARPWRVKVLRSNSLSSFVHDSSLVWHRVQTAR
jgi:DNA-binding CsgD family transcriptional regulator